MIQEQGQVAVLVRVLVMLSALHTFVTRLNELLGVWLLDHFSNLKYTAVQAL